MVRFWFPLPAILINLWNIGQGFPCITIVTLPNELLVEIFDWCRLDDEYGWNHRHRWCTLLQVCRRWRYVTLEWGSRLKLRIQCNFSNRRATMPSHLTQIPLIISFKSHDRNPGLSKKKLLLALLQPDRVSSVSVDHWCLGDLELRRALDNAFPVLDILSLSEDYGGRVLPDNFVAPHLRVLHLQNITISRGSSLLANATNLSSLRLESIPGFDYFPPEYLVECMASMPHLDNVSISFLQNSPLPDAVVELPHPHITRVALPRLSRLIYAGISLYLENLLTRISAPFLQDFRFTTSSKEILAVTRLATFLGTIKNPNIGTAVVLFSAVSVTIAFHPKQPSVTPPYFVFTILLTYDRVRAVDCATQICNAVVPAFGTVERLELELDTHYSRESSFSIQRTLWHTFLRLFGGVKVLRVDTTLARELSDALHPNGGAVVQNLLPVLSQLLVFGEDLVHQPFSSFIHARRLAGLSIDLQVTEDLPSSLPPPHIFWSFDTF